MIASSRQTLLANLMQQACAVVLLVSLPNQLDKAAYAQVVFASVLLSFMSWADLGLSLVYGRLAPVLIAAGDDATVRRWSTSTLTFGLASSCVFSSLLALIYWLKYGQFEQAVLFSALPIGLYWASFHVSRLSVIGDFTEYRRVIGMRSVTSLLALPMVMAFGLTGWFVSQTVAVLLVLVYVGRRLLEPFGRIDLNLVRGHVPEGLLLCAITAAWLQLLNFGKLYASVSYPAEAVAYYGVVGAAYQSLSALMISAFLPVTVGMLGRFGRSDKEAFDYMGQVLIGSIWWILIGVSIIIEVAPHILEPIFPSYQFDAWMLFALLLGIVFYPFLILFGNCMVGKQRAWLYLLLILAALGVSTVVAILIDQFAPGEGAAWGQLLGLIGYVWGLYSVTRVLFAEAAREVWGRAGRLLACVTLLVMFYAWLRGMWV
jgi:hypothetical protein